MSSSGEEPRAGQRSAAIAALLVSPSVEVAAERSGVPVSTLRRWLRQPRFRTRYATAAKRILTTATGRLRAVTAKAVETLETVLADPTAPPGVRVRAAVAVVELALRAGEAVVPHEREDENQARKNEFLNRWRKKFAALSEN